MALWWEVGWKQEVSHDFKEMILVRKFPWLPLKLNNTYFCLNTVHNSPPRAASIRK